MIEYTAFAFRQNKRSPVQLTFVAPTTQIDSWAKVPTRLSNKKTGFQRAALPAHVTDIAKFFRDNSNENSSPTAVLVGVEPSSQKKVKILDITTGKSISEDLISTTPLLCKVQIDFAPWDSAPYAETPDQEIEALAKSLGMLDPPTTGESEANDTSGGSEHSSDSEDADYLVEDANGAEDEKGSAASNGTPEDELGDEEDLGASEQAATEREIETFFASLSPEELRQALVNRTYTNWPPAKKERLIDILKDEPKPCLIIDGQHRVKGTRRLGNIPFTVSLLPSANWAELAFQFIVNNSSAKKVDENLLFGIVGQSLTAEQLQATEGRLNRSGIKVSLIKASMRVQLERNPFSGMLKTNTPGEKGFLDATAFQKKVIELWYGGRSRSGLEARFKQFQATDNRAVRSMAEIFGPLCSGNNTRERASFWQDDLWFKFFVAFWTPIASHYSQQLWPQSHDEWLPTDPSSLAKDSNARTRAKLMRATVLGLLQVAVLQAWADHQFRSLAMDDKDFKDLNLTPPTFSAQIEKFIRRLPPDFFTTLTYTGFDASKPLREEMLACMLDVLDGHKTLSQVKDEHKRFWE